LGYKDIEIRKSECVAITQLLWPFNSMLIVLTQKKKDFFPGGNMEYKKID